MSGLQSSKALWYLTRGTGLVSLVMLTVSVVLGIAQSVRWERPRWPRVLTSGLHRNVSLLVTAFLGVHIVTAVLDTFAPIRWLDVVFPFASGYRPIWLGLGTVAFDLLIALVITSLLRLRLGYGAWRVVHWTAYACWPIALVHGLGTGSDTRIGWSLTLQAACLIAVTAAVAWRLTARWNAQDSSLRLMGATWAGVALIAIVAFTLLGPLRPGWSRRAGTPVALLAGGRTASAAGPAAAATTVAPPSPAPAQSSPTLTVPFTSDVAGNLSRAAASGGQEAVTIVASLQNGASGALRVVRGTPLAGGGVEMQTSSAKLGPSSQPDQYVGQIVSLAGTRIDLALRDAAGIRIRVSLNLRIDEGTGTLSGTATGTAL